MGRCELKKRAIILIMINLLFLYYTTKGAHGLENAKQAINSIIASKMKPEILLVQLYKVNRNAICVLWNPFLLYDSPNWLEEKYYGSQKYPVLFILIKSVLTFDLT